MKSSKTEQQNKNNATSEEVVSQSETVEEQEKDHEEVVDEIDREQAVAEENAVVDTNDVSSSNDTSQSSVEHELVVLRRNASEDTVVFDEEDEDEDILVENRRGFSPPTREQLLTWLPFWGVILLGAILRFWGLGDKPLHHDESLHAYFGLQLMHNIESWSECFAGVYACYQYDPLTHGPFQFHIVAFFYKISQWLGAPEQGVNTYTVRIAAATLGTVIVGLPYFLRGYLGTLGAWLACLLLAVSPSMVYFSRFAREDIYMACFTLLMVVGVACYMRTRKAHWLIIAAAAFSLSYATKEATFLTIAIFGSFLGALVIWELGLKLPFRSLFRPSNFTELYLPRSAAPLALVLYFLLMGIVARFFFGWLKELSIFITKHKTESDAFVENLKDATVSAIPWIGITLGVFVLLLLLLEVLDKLSVLGFDRLARQINPRRQPVLSTLVTMPWTHWFFALLVAWVIYLVLFTVLFTNMTTGIGDGIWQGLYYWLEQQQVARGDQPWFYYLLLIPLYEQVGLVFGFVGIVYSILRPNRFRLFLVYWFVGNLFIYSWASEKMPWLMVHTTMPLLLLAAVGLQPIVKVVITLIRGWWISVGEKKVIPIRELRERPHVEPKIAGIAVATFLLALLLLIPTLNNMFRVTYVNPANAPQEMMVYVQTTTDVNIVMSKLEELDRKFYGGKREMPIGLANDATWPYAWYLRDYSRVCYDFPKGCPDLAKDIPVIITGGDSFSVIQQEYASDEVQPGYAFHQYKLRSWWSEGYKLPPVVCQPEQVDCEPTWGGVGPLLWLSYGDQPPANATFNPGRAANNIWQWWWQRKPIGNADGAYPMGLFIRQDLARIVAP